MDNERRITRDNITLGFNYLRQQYYITNKGKTVYSYNIEDVLNIANGVFMLEPAIERADLEACATREETLHTIYYTWQDNGAYIHTLQFNDFEKYPLTVDCEKQKLYIMNSNVVFDLTVDESEDKVRLPMLRAYYRDTLGLAITQSQMKLLYNMLLEYYKPTCYNQIEVDEETGRIYYNNIFLSSNYDDKATVVYNCTRNPNNTTNGEYVTSILRTDTNTNLIYLAEPISTETEIKYNIRVGSKITIQGANIVIAENNYSADGTYTISTIYNVSEEDTRIKALEVTESLPISYEFPSVTCLVEAVECNITGMSREDSTITVTGEDVQYLLTGDKVIVRNADIASTYEEVSLNGEYTIQSIEAGENNTYILHVQENILTDYAGNTGKLIKGISLGELKKAETTGSSGDLENTITLINLQYKDTEPLIDLLQEGDTIYMSDNVYTSYTVQEHVTGDNSIQVLEPVQEYNIEDLYPKLLYPNPSEEILINVTSVDESLEDVFPIGEFMVDSFEEVQEYINMIVGSAKPSEQTYKNMYKDISDSMEIPEHIVEGNTMYFVGLYSQRYSEGV